MVFRSWVESLYRKSASRSDGQIAEGGVDQLEGLHSSAYL